MTLPWRGGRKVGGRTGEAPRAAEGYRMVPCPVRPFRDDADRAAALGAAIVFVAREITGEWPQAEAVKAVVDSLLKKRPLDEAGRSGSGPA